MKKFFILISFVTSYSFSQNVPQMKDFTIKAAQAQKMGVIPVLTKSKKIVKEEFFPINKNHKIFFREYVIARIPISSSSKVYYKYSLDCNCLASTSNNEKEKFSINLAFWGIEPRKNITSYFFSTGQSIANIFISDIFKNIASVAPEYLIAPSYINPELHLIVLSALPKESYTYLYLNKQINSINSSNLYILWNKSNEPELPEFIKTNHYEDILLPVSYNPIKYIDKNIIVNFDELEAFLNYKIFTSKDTIKSILEENTIKYIPDSKTTYLGMEIEKPYGYNIVCRGDSDSSEWNSGVIKLTNKSKYPINYKLVKVPAFKFYYIDPSEVTNTKSFLNTIFKKLDIDTKNPFLIYISNGSNPYTTNEINEWQTLIKKVSDLNIEPPIIGKDINQIKEIVDFNQISKRTSIEFNVFMSGNSYKYSLNSLLDLFKVSSGEDRVVNIYLDYDEENALSGCNYFNINKIK